MREVQIEAAMIPFELYARSLATAICVVAPLLAVGNLIVWRQTGDRTVLWWAAGNSGVAIAAAVALAGPPGLGPANAPMVLALICYWAGIRCFHRQAPPTAPRATPAGLAASLFVVLAAAILPDRYGTLLATLAIGGVSLACAVELLVRRHKLARGASRFVGALFAVHALFHLVVALLIRPAEPSGPVAPALLEFVAIGEGLLLLIGWNFGVVMMAMQRYLDLVIELATIDDLTGALNRRAFGDRARQHLRLAARGGPRPSLLALDLDHFKRINDTYGHGAGDAVLREFVRVARSCLRDSDLIGRIGGEEFAILLPAARAAGACALAERLRRALAGARIPHGGQELTVTVSIGVAEYADPRQDLDGLLQAADAALYQAKHRGRNRVELASGDGPGPAPNVHLVWDGRYACGHPVIDAEHRRLVEMVNDLVAKAQLADDVRTLHGDLAQVLDWLGDHFRHEESIFRPTGWSGAHEHAREHRALEARGRELLAGILDGRHSFAELLDFLIREVVGIHLAQRDAGFFPLLESAAAGGRSP